MDFLKKNAQKQEPVTENGSKIAEAENGWLGAKKAIDDAFLALGKAYFEANKDNAESDFSAQIDMAHSKIKEEYLWHQYRLSLDGQRMCDSCESIITGDSAFCNRCGATVAPIDFSPIAHITNPVQAANLPNQGPRCPKCGAPVIVGAMFCEACGMKIG